LKDDVYSERNIIYTYEEQWLQSKTKTKMHLLGGNGNGFLWLHACRTNALLFVYTFRLLFCLREEHTFCVAKKTPTPCFSEKGGNNKLQSPKTVT
jgi:hypothetical protein